MANKDYATSSFSNDKAYRRTPMFLKKTPKAKGTYLAITESYYDKEKKATRQKTIMGLYSAGSTMACPPSCPSVKR